MKNKAALHFIPRFNASRLSFLMDEFGDMLRGMRCVYKLEKHIEDWKNSFSCQIRIFVSRYC